MAGVPHALDDCPGGIEHEDVGRLTELFAAGSGGTLRTLGDDGPCTGNYEWWTI